MRENTSTKRDSLDRYSIYFKVLARLATVHGDTNLDSFHDRVWSAAMGWQPLSTLTIHYSHLGRCLWSCKLYYQA
jgi:hypothetical protein